MKIVEEVNQEQIVTLNFLVGNNHVKFAVDMKN